MQILYLKLEAETTMFVAVHDWENKQARAVVSVDQTKLFKQLNMQLRADWKV